MEKEKDYRDIELRSEEVQEVMNKVPPGILRYGTGILASIVMVLLVGSALFRYPEAMKVEVTLSPWNPPAYIKSKGSGRLERLYVGNGQEVKKGDALAVLENVASTEEVLHLRSCLDDWLDEGARPERLDRIFFRRMPRLGSVQGAYASCLSAWNSYLQHVHENRSYGMELDNAVAQLVTAVGEWESAYLITAPMNGKSAFMQLWREGQHVAADETLFVVVPEGESELVGKALLPMQGAGKVRTGQRVVVRIEGFPEQEYGRMEGEVASLSPVPDEGGNYVMEIRFHDATQFRNGRKMPVLKVMAGTAEIIIQEQSLLQRLFKQ